jgi:phosphoglucan,water dikinase
MTGGTAQLLRLAGAAKLVHLLPLLVVVQWVTTGAIGCAEGGGHYRPNHHARLGQDMFRALEWTLEEDYGQERMRSILARKLQPLLPSFSEAFTQSVPLTRIRDIAHRNDLPHVGAGGG